ncbi:ArpU family phage packaging/lysis transcriptional regulator [Brevibacillus centrosporus]|uniref:ArpU family phage packaging/lysis transcriptional regulator n=1 Tax=Brevibacillus centrosporus TaxID=54910 RepID=UPI000F0A8C84|nr:ArpU family phage packaging/lysis transcriptional regulator [Brevibacillus centrosporus]MEC2131930.1 ArpU family phage packaging/lysis transcriptional regulator [Brevibacillus centrosporus]RNB62757.1 transcriptional regulator [Brevibacillus centrosporus]GED35060.1 ArpU family transcriptional regulator [Brevibacillus centrosporus]
MQISFLPELDRKRTQKAVEEAFRQYRLFKYLSFDEREPTITASYELREGGRTNLTSDQTASIATHNIDGQAGRRAYLERVERAVNRLPRMEKFLIQERYMSEDSEYITDYAIYCHSFNPPISEGTYTKIRWKAFYKIALSLNIEVIKDKVVNNEQPTS